MEQARIQDFHRLGAAVTRAAHFPGHEGGMARGAALCANVRFKMRSLRSKGVSRIFFFIEGKFSGSYRYLYNNIIFLHFLNAKDQTFDILS